MRSLSLLTRIRQKGIFNSIELIFNRVVPAWLFRLSIGDVFQLDHAKLGENESTNSGTDLRFRTVDDSKERDLLRAVTWNTVPIQTTSNDFGYAIIRPDRPTDFLGGVWGGIESFTEENLGFRIELEPDQGWIYCAYVERPARGKGVYQQLLAFASGDMTARGIERLYVVIQPWNHTSIHVHRKYSQRRVGRIAVIRVLGLAAVFKTGLLLKSKTLTSQIEKDPVVFRLP